MFVCENVNSLFLSLSLSLFLSFSLALSLSLSLSRFFSYTYNTYIYILYVKFEFCLGMYTGSDKQQNVLHLSVITLYIIFFNFFYIAYMSQTIWIFIILKISNHYKIKILNLYIYKEMLFWQQDPKSSKSMKKALM